MMYFFSGDPWSEFLMESSKARTVNVPSTGIAFGPPSL